MDKEVIQKHINHAQLNIIERSILKNICEELSQKHIEIYKAIENTEREENSIKKYMIANIANEIIAEGIEKKAYGQKFVDFMSTDGIYDIKNKTFCTFEEFFQKLLADCLYAYECEILSRVLEAEFLDELNDHQNVVGVLMKIFEEEFVWNSYLHHFVSVKDYVEWAGWMEWRVADIVELGKQYLNTDETSWF